MSHEIKLIVLFLIIFIFSFFIYFDPIPQPEKYNYFFDNRKIFGVTNFLNVISSTPFLMIGIVGFFLEQNKKLVHDNFPAIPIYKILFIGVFLVGLGSGYFHLAPSNERLLWDRLPMAIVFMSLSAGLLCEHIGRSYQRWLYYPLLVTGICSVLYWHFTEQQGRGDLRAYLLVQFLPLLLLPILMWFMPSRFTRRGDVWWMLGWYVLAKCCEMYDGVIFQWSGVVSGHTLKHLLAAGALLVLLHMLYCRQYKKNSDQLSKI